MVAVGAEQDGLQGGDQLVHHRIGVLRPGGEAQALGAARHGRVVDRRGVHAVLADQAHRHCGGLRGVADHQRDDVAGAVHHRQAGRLEFLLQRLGAVEQKRAAGVVGLQDAHRGERGGDGGRRQSGGENEAGGERTDIVADLEIGGDVAAMAAIGLGQRALDDGDAVRHAVTLRDAAAMRAIHADRMHLIQIGEGVVFVREVADCRAAGRCRRPWNRRSRRRSASARRRGRRRAGVPDPPCRYA